MRSTERRGAVAALAAAVVLVAGACGEGNTDPDVAEIGSAGTQQFATSLSLPPPTPPMALTSSAFAAGGPIPLAHACTAQGGGNTSPALAWSGLPPGTTSLALVMDDPDAPVDSGFVHWVVVDLDPATGGIDEGSVVGRQGVGSAGTTGYLGPCPPAGDPHTYVFTLYAFSVTPGWPDEPTRADVLAAAGSAESGALGSTVLTGTFADGG